MSDDFETDIRTALAVMAHEVDVPEDLAGRTIDAVHTLPPAAHRRFPRRAYVVMAGAAAAVLVFVAGTFITAKQPDRMHEIFGADRGSNSTQSNSSAATTVIEAPAEGTSNSGAAVAGQVSGTSAGPAGGGMNAGPSPVTPLNDLPEVVHNATISIQVRDFERAWPKANDLATKDGGYVTNSSTTESGNRVGSGTLTIRVPAGALENALADLRALGTMTKLTTSGNDVSAPMADLAARKKTSEAEEAQLQNLLSNASDVSDVLDIRNRLNDTRNEIESIEGQIHSYQDKVDFATIDATVFDRNGSTAGGPILGHGTLGRSVRTGGHIALAILAGAIVALGGLIPLAALVLLGWFVGRKIRARAL